MLSLLSCSVSYICNCCCSCCLLVPLCALIMLKPPITSNSIPCIYLSVYVIYVLVSLFTPIATVLYDITLHYYT